MNADREGGDLYLIQCGNKSNGVKMNGMDRTQEHLL